MTLDTRSTLSLIVLAACATPLAAQTPAPNAAKIRPVIAQTLPRLDGSHLTQRILEISYDPGGTSQAHSHACPVTGYVIDGALRFQVKGEPETVYRAGDSFYEAPNGVHAVSANASQTEPVRFLAIFTCDRDGPLATPVADSAAHGQ